MFLPLKNGEIRALAPKICNPKLEFGVKLHPCTKNFNLDVNPLRERERQEGEGKMSFASTEIVYSAIHSQIPSLHPVRIGP